MKSLCKFFIFGIILIVLLVTFRCFISNMFSNSLISEQHSPDGRLKVVVFERDGGATTDWSTQISVMRSRKKLNDRDTGNIIVMDGSCVEGSDYSICWVDDATIEVFIADSVKTYQKKEKYGGITIKYVHR